MSHAELIAIVAEVERLDKGAKDAEDWRIMSPVAEYQRSLNLSVEASRNRDTGFRKLAPQLAASVRTMLAEQHRREGTDSK